LSVRFFKESDGKWNAEPVIKIPKKKVDGWATPMISGMSYSLKPLIINWIYNFEIRDDD
jgi:56kDa selenium binding protein (SBP56)